MQGGKNEWHLSDVEVIAGCNCCSTIGQDVVNRTAHDTYVFLESNARLRGKKLRRDGKAQQ
jgi:hypothetical protein